MRAELAWKTENVRFRQRHLDGDSFGKRGRGDRTFSAIATASLPSEAGRSSICNGHVSSGARTRRTELAKRQRLKREFSTIAGNNVK